MRNLIIEEAEEDNWHFTDKSNECDNKTSFTLTGLTLYTKYIYEQEEFVTLIAVVSLNVICKIKGIKTILTTIDIAITKTKRKTFLSMESTIKGDGLCHLQVWQLL
jgi:hypothetical protein